VGNAINLADGIRIFEQYAKIISQACKNHETSTVTQTGTFLSGGLLPQQLAWFERLREPFKRSEVFDAYLERLIELFREARRAPETHGPPTSAEVYELQQTLPHVDPELVRLMLAIGRPSAPGYEAHISAHLLRTRRDLTWIGHQEALDVWRDTGLLHPILLAARHMPTLNDWLPVDMHEQARAWGDALTALNTARSAGDTRAALDAVESSLDWGSPAGLAVAGLLDRLAVAMRVLSNAPAGEADLDAALARFPDWSGGPERPGIGGIWKQARAALENLLPPSLLCPPLAGFRKATWGYHALTPTVEGEAIRFAERSLGWVEPHPDPSEAGRAAGALEADAGAGKSKGCARLQDVLCRMGVLALSPEIGHLMMLAIEALDHLKGGASRIAPHEQQYCQTPALLLHFMSDTGLVSDDEDIQRLADHLFASLPAVARVDKPLRLAGWRVDPPSRVVLYTGQGSPRTVLLDERSDAPRAGGIFALPASPPADPQADHAFRARLSDAMLAHMRAALREPVTETVRADGNRQHTHTALHEGLAEMALRESVLHTFVPLHHTSRWENDRQDTRCVPASPHPVCLVCGVTRTPAGTRRRSWAPTGGDSGTGSRCTRTPTIPRSAASNRTPSRQTTTSPRSSRGAATTGAPSG
jgi:hypothetical protein